MLLAFALFPSAIVGLAVVRAFSAFLAVGLALTLAFDRRAAASDTTDELISECIAGDAANLSLIEHGRAKYRFKTIGELGGAPFTWQLSVTFDGSRRRFQSRTPREVDGRTASLVKHSIVDPERVVTYYPPIDRSRRPQENVVVIQPQRNDQWVPMEPRYQRHQGWIAPPSLAELISRLRRPPAATLSARKSSTGLIEISFEPHQDGPKDHRNRGVYWLSPEHGYGMIRAHEWTGPWRWVGGEPSNTYEATFRTANTGAFVVAYRHERDCLPENGKLKCWRDEELWLDEIDLVDRPDERTFTIDDFDLPIGATIHDRLRGRDYDYGIDAVIEKQIDVAPASGPMGARQWLNYFNLAVVGALLVWAGRKLGDRATRRQMCISVDGQPLTTQTRREE